MTYLILFLLSILFASCGNDSAEAQAPKQDCQNTVDSLETVINNFIEREQRQTLYGSPEFSTTQSQNLSKSQPQSLSVKQRYTYVGQVYRGVSGGLFQVYIDETGKRQKHYISSNKKKQEILNSNSFIDVSRGTPIENLQVSQRIPY